MVMDQAAAWLAGSILFVLGTVVIVIGIVIINNILHNYWKPVQFFKWAEHPPTRFMTDDEAARIPPHLDERTK
jgi:hypothetical protein